MKKRRREAPDVSAEYASELEALRPVGGEEGGAGHDGRDGGGA